ncbi:MAG: hypothetical protein K8R50_10860 [Betaproteobacteria bacterium]|nr:hypothetical protein [Betaproteobacteria bacterium]MCX7195677.1 hypothetical protein [Pseudomonadota bacterium]
MHANGENQHEGCEQITAQNFHHMGNSPIMNSLLTSSSIKDCLSAQLVAVLNLPMAAFNNSIDITFIYSRSASTAADQTPEYCSFYRLAQLTVAVIPAPYSFITSGKSFIRA